MKIILQPGDREIDVAPGAWLHDVLFDAGVDFPCGGGGTCGGCRVRVLRAGGGGGDAPVTPSDAREFSPVELAAGWRLACCLEPADGMTLLVRQWEGCILSDGQAVEIAPRDGLGIAIDLGTTTVVAQLVDLRTGGILGADAALNRQRRWGEDLMSRLANALAEGGREPIVRSIREQLGDMIAGIIGRAAAAAALVREVVVVGNTAMRSLLMDEDPRLLAFYPFEPAGTDGVDVSAGALGWNAVEEARVFFPPLLGGLVGADILAGILATDLHRAKAPTALADLGTNAEIVVGDGRSIVVASAAAGPAFEGGRIELGMIAQKGAIDSVRVREGRPEVHVIGGVGPAGLCGSGLVDAVACGLDLGMIRPTGRMAQPRWDIAPPAFITQRDVRELQLAKGAVRAGMDLLLAELRLAPAALEKLHLAGGFGSYVSARSAARIGLFPIPPGRMAPAGNAALRGARKVLLLGDAGRAACEEVRARTRHVRLAETPAFQDAFAEAMALEAGPGSAEEAA